MSENSNSWTRIQPSKKEEPSAKEKETNSFTSNDKPSNEQTSLSQIEQMTAMFIPEQPRCSIENLIVSDTIRKQIDTALNRIKYHDILYEQWNLKSVDPSGRKVAINFYGLSGTGKTFCAEGIAHYFNQLIIRVSYSEIESKYVGDTSKAIKAAFMKAHRENSILFFDEADSILGKRLTNVTQSADHGVNVSRSTMLLELDKFDGIVLFATNLAKNYDDAFVRRILAHIEFDLPDYECRMKLWHYLKPEEIPKYDDVTVDWLAEQSEGLAGGDILNVVKLSASQAVARENELRRVSRHDIQDAINQVRASKENVGSNVEKRVIERKEEIITPEELPPDAKEKYDELCIANAI